MFGFYENMRENTEERKYKEKVKKMKNKFKINKVFYILFQTHFIYFSSSI